ncbi:MAG: hypothetical protein JWQ13_3848 [Ramlibacter sp.]|jgi:hypothetical protein|nr:hypothetical protein [Ramlibacter sp.]
MNPSRQEPPATDDSDDFWSALRTGMLLGAAALVIVLPALHYWNRPVPTTFPNAPAQVEAPATPGAPAAGQGERKLASFGRSRPTEAVRQVANWSVYSGDHQNMAIVIIDKKDARVWVFKPDGTLLSSTPALLGAAIGDESVPGIGDKPLSQVRPEEKTTPAGRFIAEPGQNLNGEDIVWVSYDLAVSMHRVRPTVKSERRLERLASPTSADNRISFGCINLPPKFYEGVLSPTVQKYGAVVYVLPETRTPAELFGAYDVPPPTHVAQR